MSDKGKLTMEKTVDLFNSGGFFWWILKYVGLPVSLPFIISKIVNYYNQKNGRKTLPAKVVVITGASSGLGEQLAHVFYRAGCKLVLAARRREELERVKTDLLNIQLNGPSYPPTVMLLDLADLETVPGFVERIVDMHGQIDILINNGGVSVRSEILSSSISVDEKVMLVNYLGHVTITKAVLPTMVAQHSGKIVFVSSVQGKFALPFRSAYCASKHALQAFADSLRAEVAHHGVKVTCISPGYIKTELSKNALTNDGTKYGKMDESTEKGYSAEYVAKVIFNSILQERKDVVVSQLSAHCAFWLRFICPSLYFWIMEKRAQKHYLNEGDT